MNVEFPDLGTSYNSDFLQMVDHGFSAKAYLIVCFLDHGLKPMAIQKPDGNEDPSLPQTFAKV
jgi:hypothetical protein